MLSITGKYPWIIESVLKEYGKLYTHALLNIAIHG